MAPSVLTLFLSAISVLKPVFAGSQAWESSIVYTQPIPDDVRSNLFDFEKEDATTGTNSTSPAPTPESKKRYVTLNPGAGNADDRIWPKGKIQYCFESSATKELFYEDLLEARKLWENAGLGSEFDWVEKDSTL